MTEHKTKMDKLIKSIKEFTEIIFIALTFFVGVYLGDYLTFNINAVIIITSFLSGCGVVLIFILDALKEK